MRAWLATPSDGRRERHACAAARALHTLLAQRRPLSTHRASAFRRCWTRRRRSTWTGASRGRRCARAAGAACGTEARQEHLSYELLWAGALAAQQVRPAWPYGSFTLKSLHCLFSLHPLLKRWCLGPGKQCPHFPFRDPRARPGGVLCPPCLQCDPVHRQPLFLHYRGSGRVSKARQQQLLGARSAAGRAEALVAAGRASRGMQLQQARPFPSSPIGSASLYLNPSSNRYTRCSPAWATCSGSSWGWTRSARRPAASAL